MSRRPRTGSKRDIGYITAPVFSPKGDVALEIAITGLPHSMSAQEIVTFFVYLVGSVTFILGLKFLSSPVSARRGNRLAPRDQELIGLRYGSGLDTAETAAVLGVREAVVRTRLWRALGRLRREIEP